MTDNLRSGLSQLEQPALRPRWQGAGPGISDDLPDARLAAHHNAVDFAALQESTDGGRGLNAAVGKVLAVVLVKRLLHRSKHQSAKCGELRSDLVYELS